MYINKKILKIALAIFGVIFLIGGTAYFLLRSMGTEQILTDEQGKELSFIGNLPQSGNTGGQIPDEGPNLQGVGINDIDFGSRVIAEDLKKRSINFIERLGSYSSDSNLSNFDDVLPQTTAEFELVLRSAKGQRLNDFNNSNLFVGYTVTAVTSEADISNLDEGSVNVTINAIREITGLNLDGVINDDKIYIINWIIGEDRSWRANGVSGDY